MELFLGVVALLVGIGIGLAKNERDKVQKRQAQLEKDLKALKEEIKERFGKYADVEI